MQMHNIMQANTKRLKTKISLISISLSILLLGTGSALIGLSSASALPSPSQDVVYNNIPDQIPGNVPSLGYEATTTEEFGSQVQFNGTARKDPTVTVLMSSWACKSGTWNNNDCITNPGSTFTYPVTLNVYSVGDNDSVGSLIKSDTETFTMPYRPTADDGTNCNAANGTAGEWWDAQDSTCYNGKDFTISFNLNGVTLPDDAIVSVAYNTSDYGVAPQGDNTACHSTVQGCPYDSLNVGTNPVPSVGTSEPSNDDAYVKGTTGYAYCDNGVSGTGTLRLDAGCWGGYLPAIEVAASSGHGNYPPVVHGHHQNPIGYGSHDTNFPGYRGFYDLRHW